MANLSNINNKFLFTDGDFLKIGNLAPINNISGTESGISITNGNCASITLDNSAAQGKTFSIYSAVNGSLNFYDVDANSGRLIIDTSGNVGISETDPSGYWGQANNIVIDTSGNGGITIKSTSAGNGRLVFTDTKSSTAGNADGGMITYNHTDDEMRFQTNGSQRIVIDSSGNATFTGNVKLTDEKILGLRTSTNDYSLQYRDLDFRLIGSADGTTQRKFSFGYYTSDNPAGTWNGKTYINSYTGNVGINVSNPGFQSVDGYGQIGIEIKGGKENNQAPCVRLHETGSGKGSFELRSTRNVLTSGNYFAIAEGTDTFFAIRGDDDGGGVVTRGYVGIGTTSPDEKLDVENGNIRIKSNSDGNTGILRMYDAAGTESGQIYPAAGDLRFYTPNDIIMSPTGNVGIGTTSPGAKVDILGLDLNIGADNGAPTTRTNSTVKVGVITSPHYTTAEENFTGMLLVGNSTANEVVLGGGTSTYNSATQIKFYTGANSTTVLGTERMRIRNDGILLISRTNLDISTQTGYRLDPNGEAYASIDGTAGTNAWHVYDMNSNNYRFYVSGAGQIYATSTSITAISDVTLKENIKPLETGLNEVMKLQPRRFDWKNGDGKNIAGFVAQEVEEILPDLVSESKYTDKETKKSLKMGDMIPTLVKAMQELKADNDSLKARIETLENN